MLAGLGRTARPPTISLELAQRAIGRHKCAPLLFAACRNGVPVDADARALLSEHWEQNQRQALHNTFALQRIASALRAAGVPALLFKGAPLARQLYADPAVRHAGDIDVMAPPAAMLDLISALEAAGLASREPLLGLPPIWQRLVLGQTRDISLDDGLTHAHVELHSRLLFSKRLSRLVSEKRREPATASGLRVRANWRRRRWAPASGSSPDPAWLRQRLVAAEVAGRSDPAAGAPRR